MKTKLVIILIVLFVASMKPVAGQKTQDDKAKTDVMKDDMSDMMSNPTFEVTKDGLHLKVWVTALKDDDADASADHATSEGMVEGTHHIMVDVKDAVSGKDVAGTTVTLQVTSPTNKSSSVSLDPMMGQFGGNLTLNEKGEYGFTVNIEANGKSSTSDFKYSVK